jgi:hypothetical protein
MQRHRKQRASSLDAISTVAEAHLPVWQSLAAAMDQYAERRDRSQFVRSHRSQCSFDGSGLAEREQLVVRTDDFAFIVPAVMIAFESD